MRPETPDPGGPAINVGGLPVESGERDVRMNPITTSTEQPRKLRSTMPFPLIPLAIGGVLILVASIAVPKVVKEVRKSLKDKTVAILGRQEVGKSTLLHFLKEGKIPDRRTRTPDPLPGGEFTLQVPGKGEAKFSVPQDLPGHTVPAYKDWRAAFESADFVWYLFRADRIVNDEASEIALVQEHLAHLEVWYEELRSENAVPKVILIGVFADQDQSYGEDGYFEERVRNSPLVSHSSTKLGRADIVVGSQASKEDAAKLVERIKRYLK